MPTYRAGVNAALGLPVDDHDLAPAWDLAHVSAPFVLPVYYSFRFQTGPGGDFASLAQKIHPPKTTLDAGTRTMDVSQPGFGAAGVPGVKMGLEGALRTFGNAPTPWPSGAQATYESQFRAALAPPAAGDPVVAPPTYGSAQSGSPLPASGATPVWLGQLNLDPRPRAAASAGSQIVRRDQEALVASAWDQWGEIQKANRLLRQAQLAREVSTSLSRRHLERVAGDGKWLQITAPLHSRVRITMAGVAATLYGQIQASRLPSGSLSPAMRKIARPAGPIGRQMKAGVPQIVDRLNMPAGSAPAAVQVAGPLQNPKGMVAFDDVSPDVQVRNMTAISLASSTGWTLATSHISISTGPVVVSPPPATPGTPVGPERPVSPVGPLTPVSPVVRDGPLSPAGGVVVGPSGPISTNAGGAAVNLVDWKTNPNLPDILKGTVANLPPPVAFPSDPAALATIKASFRTAAQSINTYLNTAPAARRIRRPWAARLRSRPCAHNC